VRRSTAVGGRRDERGAVTAEAAMVIPVLVLTVAGLAWFLTVAVAQVRVTDAAREVARLVARDEPTASAVARGREVAPPGSQFDVHVAARDVVVTVRLDLDGPAGVLGLVPGLAVDARAVAARESS
jgi:Flp pilus assembly protein TadG